MAHIKVPEQTPKLSYTVTTPAEDTFNINFVIFEVDGSDIEVYDDDVLLSSTTYTITPILGTEGGFVGGTLVLDTLVSNTTIIIIRAIDLKRITDFPTSGPFNINALNTDLDRLVAMVQQINQRAVNNAVRAADTVTDSPILEFTQLAVDRAGRILGFSTSGDIELQLGVGLWKNNWTTSTGYELRDVIRDNSAGADTKNIYICVIAHTSGTWVTDLSAVKWELMVDVESVTISTAEAAASASAASTSETNAASSASAASTSETNAASSASAASTSETNAASSASAASTSETNAASSAFDAAASTSVLQYIFDSSVVMANPGSGGVRLNNAIVSTVTTVAFSNVTAGSGTPDVSDLLAAMDDVNNAIGGAVLTFRKSGAPEVFASFYTTLVTDNISWLQASVDYIDGSGTLSISDVLMFSIAFSGEDGEGVGDLLSTNNLSDVANAATSLSNLGGIGSVEEDTTPQLSGELNGQDNIVSKVNLKDYGEVTNAIGSIGGGTQDIDLTLGNSVSGTVDTSTTTFTFSNPTASDEGCGFTLVLTNGGSQTVVWPVSVDWGFGQSAPDLVADGINIIVFHTIDGGVTWKNMSIVRFSDEFNLNNLSAVQVTKSVTTEDGVPNGIVFNDNGTKIFMIGSNNDSIYEYNLSIPYNLSTLSAVQVTKSVTTEDTIPNGIVLNDNGTKIFMIGSENNSIYEYDLSTPYDLSTLSVVQATESIASEDTSPKGITFNDNGTKIFMIGSENNSIYEYNLSTPYDLSTLSVVQVTKSVTTEDTEPNGITFNDNGTKIFMVGSENNSIYEYNLSTPYDLSTLSVVQVTKSVTTEDTEPKGIAFNNDGTKIFMVGNSTDSIYEYNL